MSDNSTTPDDPKTRPNGQEDPARVETRSAANDQAAAPPPETGDTEPAPSAAEMVEMQDRVLRALAEMENLRRRTQRDVEDARRYAVTGFARDLLDVQDNLGRALAAVPAEAREQNEFLKNLVLGVEMTERTLLAAFEKHQVRRVEPKQGERFDHKLHQAMFEVPTAAYAPGTVAEVVQAGYVIADRLLRPALVGVAKAPPQAEPAPDQETQADPVG